MKIRIEILAEKKMVGKSLKMTFANNKTTELWSSFMPKRKEISNNLTAELFSLQIYDSLFFDNFNPNKEFEKWALIEVPNFEQVPNQMKTFILPTGQYAIFIHRGDTTQFSQTIGFIFEAWLPNSNYILDNRPHFEILGHKYKHNDPNSEEEVWIPIKPKP